MLTDRKRRQLHDDIEEYLSSCGFEETAAAFAQERNNAVPTVRDESGLERKYANILRTAKLLSTAEDEVKRLQLQIEELEDPTAVQASIATRDYLPNRMIHTLKGHTQGKEITAVIFHPNQPLCYSACEDGRIKIWDYERGESENTIVGHTGAVKCLAIDKDGDRIASGSDDTEIHIIDLRTNITSRRLQGHEHTVSSVEFIAPDCRFLASASRDGTVRIWDIIGSRVDKVFHAPDAVWVRAVRVINNQFVVAAGDDHIVRCWDRNNANVDKPVGLHGHVIECLAVANPAACTELQDMLLAKEAARTGNSISATPDIQSFFVASGSRDKSIVIWNLTNCTETCKLIGHQDWVRDIAFHVNGKSLLSCSDDGTLRVWQLNDQRCTRTIRVQEMAFVSALGYHPTGRYAIAGANNGELKVYKCE